MTERPEQLVYITIRQIILFIERILVATACFGNIVRTNLLHPSSYGFCRVRHQHASCDGHARPMQEPIILFNFGEENGAYHVLL